MATQNALRVSCDGRNCPEFMYAHPDAPHTGRELASAGWWVKHGAHLCPAHHPDRVIPQGARTS